ncbi:MAG: hypothetical protein ACM31C_25860 [Acidobacteriota bacterium]
MPPSVIVFLRHLELAMRLHTAVPALDLVDAYAHAAAATDAATSRVDAETLLAIAFVESRFDPTATSRVVAGKRRTGHYPSTDAPAHLDRHASLYCGPLQTFASTWSQCLALRDLPAAYAAGASELEQWLHDRRVRGDLALALAGHGCGNRGIVTGKCNHYPARVLWIAHRLAAVKPTS